jgi:tellurite resistance protein TerC
LFWGILGALVMRGIFIGAGIELIHHFHWILYVFGVLLVYSGARVCALGGHQFNPAKNPVVNAVRRWIPVNEDYVGGRFFVRRGQEKSQIYATPLLLVLVVIETTDVLFAVDSIPAVLAITLNAFIVYTSNVFAILGLRSMYFSLSALRIGSGADPDRGEDADRGLFSDFYIGYVGRGSRSAGGVDCGLRGEAREGNC